jgi:hypothetical protein
MRIIRVRQGIQFSYLTAREQAEPTLRRFLLDVVLWAKVFAF